jgi:hypothetical protein
MDADEPRADCPLTLPDPIMHNRGRLPTGNGTSQSMLVYMYACMLLLVCM